MSERITKTCPWCGQPLEIKVNRETGHEFLGCMYTEPLPESIKLRRQGQKGMFDDD